MSDKKIKIEFSQLTNDKRGVSPLIAVAILILVAAAMGLAINERGMEFLEQVEQPPEAQINSDPGGEELRLTVSSVSNADKLDVQIDGETVEHNGNSVLNASSGETVVLTWDGGDLSINGESSDVSPSTVDPGISLISVVAINEPDAENTVFEYEIPE